MNRPKQRGPRHVREFADGNRCVARFNRKGNFAWMDWKRPPAPALREEYLEWRQTITAHRRGRCWLDLWPF